MTRARARHTFCSPWQQFEQLARADDADHDAERDLLERASPSRWRASARRRLRRRVGRRALRKEAPNARRASRCGTSRTARLSTASQSRRHFRSLDASCPARRARLSGARPASKRPVAPRASRGGQAPRREDPPSCRPTTEAAAANGHHFELPHRADSLPDAIARAERPYVASRCATRAALPIRSRSRKRDGEGRECSSAHRCSPPAWWGYRRELSHLTVRATSGAAMAAARAHARQRAQLRETARDAARRRRRDDVRALLGLIRSASVVRARAPPTTRTLAAVRARARRPRAVARGAAQMLEPWTFIVAILEDLIASGRGVARLLKDLEADANGPLDRAQLRAVLERLKRIDRCADHEESTRNRLALRTGARACRRRSAATSSPPRSSTGTPTRTRCDQDEAGGAAAAWCCGGAAAERVAAWIPMFGHLSSLFGPLPPPPPEHSLARAAPQRRRGAAARRRRAPRAERHRDGHLREGSRETVRSRAAAPNSRRLIGENGLPSPQRPRIRRCERKSRKLVVALVPSAGSVRYEATAGEAAAVLRAAAPRRGASKPVAVAAAAAALASSAPPPSRSSSSSDSRTRRLYTPPARRPRSAGARRRRRRAAAAPRAALVVKVVVEGVVASSSPRTVGAVGVVAPRRASRRARGPASCRRSSSARRARPAAAAAARAMGARARSIDEVALAKPTASRDRPRARAVARARRRAPPRRRAPRGRRRRRTGASGRRAPRSCARARARRRREAHFLQEAEADVVLTKRCAQALIAGVSHPLLDRARRRGSGRLDARRSVAPPRRARRRSRPCSRRPGGGGADCSIEAAMSPPSVRPIRSQANQALADRAHRPDASRRGWHAPGG